MLDDSDPWISKRVAHLLDQGSPLQSLSPRQKELLKACLYGEASGDALGVPVEFAPLEVIEEIVPIDEYLQDPGRPQLKPGDHSDDFQMPTMLLDSMSRFGQLNPSEVASEFAALGLALDLGTITDQGWSPRTLMSYRRLYAGLNWRLTARPTHGSGPATTRRSPGNPLRRHCRAAGKRQSHYGHY